MAFEGAAHIKGKCGGGQATEAEILVPGSSLLGAASGCGGGGAGAAPDVVVATPGRLVAHLQGTRGFSLGGLQFLVRAETTSSLVSHASLQARTGS